MLLASRARVSSTYKIIDNEKSQDSLADLAKDIIDSISYANVKPEVPNPGKFHSHWVDRELTNQQIGYAAIDAHVSFEVYRRIHRMRQCLKDDPLPNGLRRNGGKGKGKGKKMKRWYF